MPKRLSLIAIGLAFGITTFNKKDLRKKWSEAADAERNQAANIVRFWCNPARMLDEYGMPLNCRDDGGTTKKFLACFGLAVMFAPSTALTSNEPIVLPQYSFILELISSVRSEAGLGIPQNREIPTLRILRFRPLKYPVTGRVEFVWRPAQFGRPLFCSLNLNEYGIVQWTTEHLVATLNGTAARIELTFDFKKKVILLTHREKSESPTAKHLPDRAHLDEGTKAVERALRK